MTGGMWYAALRPVEVFDNGLSAFPRYKAAIRSLALEGTKRRRPSEPADWNGAEAAGCSVCKRSIRCRHYVPAVHGSLRFKPNCRR